MSDGAHGSSAGDDLQAPPARPLSDVLAVVPTLDPLSSRLAGLLASLERLEGGLAVQTLVVVNRGRELPTRADDRDPQYRSTGATIVETGLNLGFGGSVTFASTLADFSHLWLLQDDLEVSPSCLSELFSALERDASLGAVNPTRITTDGRVTRRSAGGRLGADGRIDELLPRSTVALDRYVPDAPLDFIMSRGMLVRGAAWKATGGMDARFYPVGWSDVDLSTRLRAAGWSLATVPTATVRHEKAGSTPRALGEVTFERNRELFRQKWSGAGERPEVHPDIPRELLEAVAQSAGSLALDLAHRMEARPRGRTVAGTVRRAVHRLVRILDPRRS
jgi:GT2 family glycosyltransferase